MTPTSKNLEREMKRLANPQQAVNLARFFKTGPGQYGAGDHFLGIKVPQTRIIAKKYRGLTLTEIEKLFTSPFHEIRLAALLITIDQFERKPISPISQRKIVSLYLKQLRAGRINNWDHVDLSAPRVIGAYLLDKPRVILDRLVKSKNLWERRVAIISTLTFIRHDNFSDTLKISEKLLTDKHDLIHKAVGWTLREVGKRSYQTEEKFLKKHYRNMPRTMLRYAIERFQEHRRLAYLRGLV